MAGLRVGRPAQSISLHMAAGESPYFFQKAGERGEGIPSEAARMRWKPGRQWHRNSWPGGIVLDGLMPEPG